MKLQPNGGSHQAQRPPMGAPFGPLGVLYIYIYVYIHCSHDDQVPVQVFDVPLQVASCLCEVGSLTLAGSLARLWPNLEPGVPMGVSSRAGGGLSQLRSCRRGRRPEQPIQLIHPVNRGNPSSPSSQSIQSIQSIHPVHPVIPSNQPSQSI